MLGTADLCDKFGDSLQYAYPIFQSFGGRSHFSGRIVTIKCFEDNTKVKEPGKGNVLVIDGGGSLRRAMVGDLIAESAVKNQWNGIIVNGCIRDSEEINKMKEIGIKALGTHPRKTEKKNLGEVNIEVHFAGVLFRPGEYVVADADGVVVSKEKIEISAKPRL